MSKIRVNKEDVSRETLERIDELYAQHIDLLRGYAELLLWWNNKINLVSRSMKLDELMFHVKHCLFLSPFLNNDLILDTGCGGGLPGIPLALVHPERKFILNDKVSKKILAVKDMARKLNTNNINSSTKSVETLKVDDKIQLISKHAFKLNDLIQKTRHLNIKKFSLLKGVDYLQDLNEVNDKIELRAIDLTKAGSFFKDKYVIHFKLMA